MVGDDLLADIKGGINAGVDTCWYNPRNVENKTDIAPKFTVGSYEELYRIVMEPEELENLACATAATATKPCCKQAQGILPLPVYKAAASFWN